MLNIGLRPEYIISIFGISLTNTFVTSIIVALFLEAFVIFFYFRKNKHRGLLFKMLKVTVFELLKLTDTVTQDRALSKKILPLIATFFLFIVTANLVTLIPGFLGSFFIRTSIGEVSFLRSPNSDLTTTLALALVSVLAIQIFSWKVLGAKLYLERFFNFINPMHFFLGFFELLSEMVKILSFSFRLFGNMFAGEILLLVIAFLIPYIIPIPFMILEVFVGLIQAFIFAILTLTFIKTGTLSPIGPGKQNSF